MPWCPVCKNEYREGFTACAECKVPLVETFEDIPVAIYFGGEKEIASMVKFLKENGLKDAFMSFDKDENVYELFVKNHNEKTAKRMLKELIENTESKRLDFSDLGLFEDGSEYEEEDEEEEGDIENQIDSILDQFDEERLNGQSHSFSRDFVDDTENKEVSVHEEMLQFHQEKENKKSVSIVYQNKYEKAEEYKSSASALMIVGVLGILLIIINEMNVLPLALNFNKPMVYGVMGSVFVLFIIFSIYSRSQYKKILIQAKAEDDVTKQIKEFLKMQFSKSKILLDETDSDKTEEQLYFVRTAKMKTQLLEQFADVEEALIDKMVDDHYDELFS